jgi:hypothetical protein
MIKRQFFLTSRLLKDPKFVIPNERACHSDGGVCPRDLLFPAFLDRANRADSH